MPIRVVLISPYPDVTSFGLRTIAAHLKAHGVAVRLLFTPDPFGDELMEGVPRYPKAVLDDVAALCAEADLVGVGLMTNYFDNARELTAAVKARHPALPVVWGGVHPTIRPGECLEHADYVCQGDGEEAMLELARALGAGDAAVDATAIPNIWTMQTLPDGEGGVVREPIVNAPRSLTRNLDEYPAPDYSCEDHWLATAEAMVPFTLERLQTQLAAGTVASSLGMVGYQTMTGRGCPHKCTYCINDAVKRLYGPRGYLRWRSTEHVMQELETVRSTMPWVEFIWISDDAFFGRSQEAIQEFCAAYKARVGLPFTCLASPLTMSEAKLDALVDAGLVYLQMGVQSGSPRIQALFNRKAMHNEAMLRAMRVINKYKDVLRPPNYDFILDTPYETREDKIASIRFIARIPKPFGLQPFSLVLYPGTQLHEMAAADGLLADERRDVYTKSYAMREPSYFNLLIAMAKGGRMPGWLLRAAVSPPVAAVFGSDALKPAIAALYAGLRRGKRLLMRLRHGPPPESGHTAPASPAS